MKTQTSKLLDIFTHMKLIFLDNRYTEDSQYIFFNKKDNIIWAYCDDLIYRHHPPFSIEEEYGIESDEIALPAKEIYTLLKKIKSEEISTKEKNGKFIIRTDKSTNSFAIRDIKSDKTKYDLYVPMMGGIPKEFGLLFKKYAKYDKIHTKTCNIIFDEGFVITSDNFNMVRIITPQIKLPFAISWDVAKHIGELDFIRYGHDNSIVEFRWDYYSLVCRNEIDDIFKYKHLFEKVEDNYCPEYAITLDKEEDFSFIDAVLMNYKTADKKITINISEDKAMITAMDNKKEQEIRANVAVTKYDAGEEDNFTINPVYFSEVHKDYDWFIIMDGMLHCHNAVDGVDRIISISN